MTQHTTISVVLAPHEREAMHKLILISRSVAKMIDGPTAAAIQNHAQAVEDILSRLDRARQEAACASS